MINYTDGPCDKQDDPKDPGDDCHRPDTTYIDDCIDKTKTASPINCVEVYDPVCGCNGITYSNSCEATSAGVKEFKSGPCYTILPIDSNIILYDAVK